MSTEKTTWFEYIRVKDIEEIIVKSASKSEPENFSERTFGLHYLGESYCSLLNCKDILYNFRENFKQTYFNKYEDITDLKDILKDIHSVFNQLIKVNGYLYITFDIFFEIMDETISISEISSNIKDSYDFSMNRIYDVLTEIINSISLSENCYNYTTSVNGLSLPPVLLNAVRFFEDDYSCLSHTYTIKNIDELLKVSSYQIITNKIHLKKCIYPNCNKYFTTDKGQTRYCENPCPDNPLETCRSIRKNIDRSSDTQEDWEIALDISEQQLNRIRTRFYDNIGNKNLSQRKREMISNNKEKLSDITKELKRRIKGNHKGKRKFYLKIYEEFLNEVETNLKSSPSVFKIKKPNY